LNSSPQLAANLKAVYFTKYHGLGNDYLVIEPSGLDETRVGELAQKICDRHYGVGGDGILVGPLPSASADFGLRIFNPDGSEAEKSGNGLRIFARCLWDQGLAGSEPFTVQTAGGLVRCQVFEQGDLVQVEMGQASFLSPVQPAACGEPVEALHVGDQVYQVCTVSLGNPHCVVLDAPVSRAEALRLGPLIENQPRFSARTNVQFLRVIDRSNLQIEIWERGAGYTLASGSSACAAASVAHRLDWCGAQVLVHMPGGALQVTLAADSQVTQRGPVVKVCAGQYFWEECIKFA
jgi:diaminopimelate epimerase